MSLAQKIVVLVLVLPVIFFFDSCGSNNHSTTAGTSGSGSGPTGSTPTGSPGQPASPKFLYSSDNSGNRILGYLVNSSTGAIRATSQGSLPTHTGPTRVAADSTGTHLYVINYTSKDLSAYSISRTDGSLTSVPGAPFAIGQTPTGVAVAPSGAFVYATTFDTPTTPTSFVYAFAVQSNGSLTPVPGSPFPAADYADALAIDPQGKYLYIRTQTSPSQVGAYSINSDGALTPVPGSPYAEPSATGCANGASDMAVNTSGNFLLLPSFCEGIVIYHIDRTSGALSLVTGSPFLPTGGPGTFGAYISIAMDPQGVYFWITDDTTTGLPGAATDTWKLDPNSGVPTFVETNNGACGLLVRSDPSGNFVYETGGFEPCPTSTTQGILGFNVNRGTGALGNISGSPWPAPNSLSSDQSGLAITP